MRKRANKLTTSERTGPYLRDFVLALDRLSPPALAQTWDNLGLLIGDGRAAIRSVLLCIDMMPDVVAEAVRGGVDLIAAYHPPLFKPISRLLADSRATDAQLLECMANRIAVYAMHTALDAAAGGTNDVLAEMCGIAQGQPIELVEAPGRKSFKLVVFVPPGAVDKVADAMAGAGAGVIGEYQRCSFRIPGRGTFQGSVASRPAMGKAGRFESVDEVRLEMIVSEPVLNGVVAALRSAHPYEEPAFDLYALTRPPVSGIGRWGLLPQSMRLGALARKLKHAVQANSVQIVGDKSAMVGRAIIVAGAGGSIPFKMGLTSGDVVITGEMRHHDALALLRHGAKAIVMNHWTSERPVLDRVAKRLADEFPTVKISISQADAEPFSAA